MQEKELLMKATKTLRSDTNPPESQDSGEEGRLLPPKHDNSMSTEDKKQRLGTAAKRRERRRRSRTREHAELQNEEGSKITLNNLFSSVAVDLQKSDSKSALQSTPSRPRTHTRSKSIPDKKDLDHIDNEMNQFDLATATINPLAAKMSARVAEIARHKQKRTKSVDLGHFNVIEPRAQGQSAKQLSQLFHGGF